MCCTDRELLVIPAQAGIQYAVTFHALTKCSDSSCYWMPAYAGMTRLGAHDKSSRRNLLREA